MENINKNLLKNIKILYVEDEKKITDELKIFFDKFVKEFHVANNGKEGLELFSLVNPDIIITDIQMPVMNGLEMLKQINSNNTPVIITTAYTDSDYFLKAIELKVNKFVIKPINLLNLIHDIQDLVLENNLHEKLFEKEVLLDIVDKNVLISITDKDGKILDVSEAFCNLTGYTKSEFIGNTHRLLKHDDTPNSFYENMWKHILSGKNFSTEIKNKNKKGKTYWTKLMITPVKKEGKIDKFIAIRQDITSRKKLELLTIEDDLTKIYNKRYFNRIIDREVRRIKREKSIISLVCLDIDFFKKYNDSFGHQKGDEILVKITTALKKTILKRATDYLFRIGGEEFCIIFSGVNIQKSFEFTKEIIKDIEDLNIKHKDGSTVTISAGLIVQSGEFIENETTLFKYADDALYEAKNLGRNQVILSKFSK